MKKNKDAFTDAVEALQDGQGNQPEESGKDRRVVNEDGEVITLGQDGSKTTNISNKANQVELSPEELSKAISGAVKDGVKKAVEEREKRKL
jgi:hypothetical protein